jgi:hypothetical protein
VVELKLFEVVDLELATGCGQIEFFWGNTSRISESKKLFFEKGSVRNRVTALVFYESKIICDVYVGVVVTVHLCTAMYSSNFHIKFNYRCY